MHDRNWLTHMFQIPMIFHRTVDGKDKKEKKKKGLF